MDLLCTYLSDSYTGDITVMDGGGENVQIYRPSATVEHMKQIRKQGSVEYAVPFWKWDGTVKYDLGTLTFTVIRENDTYKVSDYTFTPAQ